MSELLELLGGIDWIYIISATILMMLIGTIWYAKWAFGKKYFERMGMQDEDGDGIKDGMGLAMILEFISRFFVACGIYLFLDSGGEVTASWFTGLGFVLVLYVVFIAPTILSDVVRSAAKNKLVFWISAGGQLAGILGGVGLYYLFLVLK
ncbi:MAG: DUF1761 domain-containing protein [Candidatus Absconditabacterales bacterium]